MQKNQFLVCLQNNSFGIDIFKDYYEEHSEKTWDPQHFQSYLQHMNMFGLSSAMILNNTIIPYYKSKFEVQELLDKEGKLIKIINE